MRVRRTSTDRPQPPGGRGFTIVEILVVVIIIGVLATLIVPKFFGRVGAARQNTARSNLVILEQAVQMFTNDYGREPASLEELVSRPADIDEQRWIEPTVQPKHLIDPWGRPYQYQCPGAQGRKYDLYSYGADGQPGGAGEDADVVNW